MAEDGRRSRQRALDLTVGTNFLGIGVLLSAVPRFVREDLGGTAGQVGLATTIFFAGALLARPIAGRRMDRIGRRPFLVVPLLAVAAVAFGLQLVAAMGGGVAAVVLLRLVQGVFGAAFYTAAAAMATDLATPAERPAAIARLSLVIYLGFAIGPPIGEWLVDRGPGLAFVVAGGLHLAAFMTSFRLTETLDRDEAAEQLATPRRVQARARRAAVLAPGVAQLCAGIGMSAVFAFLPQYAREIGLGSSGALFTVYAASALLVRVVVGRALDRLGAAGVAMLGLASFVAGHTLLALAWTPEVLFVGVALAGVGFGGILPGLSAVAVMRSPEWQRGAVLGLFFAFNDVGMALGGPVIGLVVDAFGVRWSYGGPAVAAAVGLGIAVAALGPPRAVRGDR